MKVYFQIQGKIINRQIKEAGLNIFLAWILAIITLIGLSIALFNQYKYAEYLYPLIPTFFAVRLADFKRKEFLRICYGNRKFHLIRFLENLFLSLPFLIFLILYQHYIIATFLFLVVSSLAYTQWKSRFYYIMPTPFQKYPFEFVVGFRKTFLLIVLIFALTIIAIKFDNFNLGLFSIILGFLTSMSYYSFVEDPFYVWTHIEKPKRFLLRKIQFALIFNSQLYLFQIIALCFFFFEKSFQILILYGVGNFFLVYIVFIKYAAFPNKIGLKESIILAFTIYFPPLIFLTLPYFYIQSLSSLSKVLK